MLATLASLGMAGSGPRPPARLRVLLRHYLEQELRKAEIARTLGVSARILEVDVFAALLACVMRKRSAALAFVMLRATSRVSDIYRDRTIRFLASVFGKPGSVKTIPLLRSIFNRPLMATFYFLGNPTVPAHAI